MSEHDPSQQGWKTLEAFDADTFRETRLQIHWAAQVVAAVGDTHLPKSPDDGQNNTGWVDGMQLLAGRYLGDPPVGFATLTPAAATLGFHEPGGEPLTTIEIGGRTLDELYEAMETAIASATGDDPVPLDRPNYDMPDHAVAAGAAFGPLDPAALRALHDVLHDANLVMRDLKARTTSANASLPRLWPHHFDLGMLVSLEDHGNPAEGRSIGVGLSLGDESDPLPYWYVSAYPRPESLDALPQPTGGNWTTEGFVGMKFDAAAMVGDGTGQEQRTRAFVGDAVSIARGLLLEED